MERDSIKKLFSDLLASKLDYLEMRDKQTDDLIFATNVVIKSTEGVLII